MTERFHARLDAELSAGGEPPAPDLVAGALTQGRRMVVRHRWTGYGVAAAVVLLSAVLVLAGMSLRVTPPPADRSPTRPATAATLAVHLRQLLPTSRFTTVYRSASDAPTVTIALVRAGGAGVLQLWIDEEPLSAQACQPGAGYTASCQLRPDGSTTVVWRAVGSCDGSFGAEVFRTDRVHVAVLLDGCGTGDPPPSGPPALTAEEGLAIVVDPHWGIDMDAATVAVGEREFPSLPVAHR